MKQSTQKESAKVRIDSITKTNASCTVNFSDVLTKEMTEKWFSSYLYVEVRDDLGNIYKGQENGGTGGKAIDSNGNKTSYKPVIDADHPEKGQIIFDDIVVDLEK